MSKPAIAAKTEVAPNNLDSFWMPFSAGRQFRSAPRMFVSAKGMHYTTGDGRQVLDGTAGLWCCNLGHGHPRVVEAVQKQIAEMDFAPAFQLGHPKAFKLASRVAALMPGALDRIFFVNSGSEAVDTALKMALAYHYVRGQGHRTKLIGRARSYHGVGFGGISVGGIAPNRKPYGPLLPGVDHLPHTHNLEKNAFSRGQPQWGAHLADELENIIAVHSADNIAAVIIEPVAGSTGVLIPPQGYLEKIREICTKHGILLIFDEVITAFGRVGNKATAAEVFGVQPDIITMAKGLTAGTIPMGAVAADRKIYDAFLNVPDNTIEFFHGYTYTGHPVAAAAGIATLDAYLEEGLFERTAMLAPYWEQAIHALRGLPHIIDIRNIGLVGAIELAPRPGKPTARAFEAFIKCFEQGLLIRTTGDIIALSPPLIVSKEQIDEIFDKLSGVLKKLG
ncbi:MAG TPA: aspartate aminotransferase family protein [Patescibacteria group bacterium]|nr:aspartate aminotransferase family protein [Patescibacteria group bacterium]